LLTSIGAGGIRPCVCAFGGDQFVMPDQEDRLQMYFSIFYFTINLGSLLSSSITPELRKSVQCFGKDSCFPLAFGVPAFLMMISIGKIFTIKYHNSSISWGMYHSRRGKLWLRGVFDTRIFLLTRVTVPW